MKNQESWEEAGVGWNWTTEARCNRKSNSSRTHTQCYKYLGLQNFKGLLSLNLIYHLEKKKKKS